MTPDKKITLIQEQMAQYGIDAYIVPTSDSHASEYLPEFYKTREWASGFTGSAGTLVITRSKSALWTDGRYHIQAEGELKDTNIHLMKTGQPSVPTIASWLISELNDGFTIGFNGFQMMTGEVENLSSQMKELTVTWDFTSNLIDKLWLDRPQKPCEKVYQHSPAYAGDSAITKIDRVRKTMLEAGANGHLICKLDDIAWLLNLRGDDITHNPYFLSYLYVSEEDATLYIAPLKLNADIIELLRNNRVNVKHYKDIIKDLDLLRSDSIVMIDKATTPYHLFTRMDANAKKVIHRRNPSTDFKAIKSDVELDHLKQCYIDDGAAVVNFLYWLEKTVPNGTLSEVDIDEKITALRAEHPLYQSRSFSTIAAYKDHAAIMHYRATPENSYIIEPKGLLLVDSGGQYHHGTTDITRTVGVGPLTEQEKMDYTLTLKSMMALSRTRFLEGATGTHLDQAARQVMWAHDMDYKSGTGHGIGYFLGVHEGPHRVAMHLSDVALVPGMVLSNEPGVYRTGVSGVRLENIIYVVPHLENAFGRFFKFETLTMCPFDLNAIELSMLTSEEKNQLNDYHKTVRAQLTPLLSSDVASWLAHATREV
ncbi:MAG TPA: peptidase M24 [Clostridiales bacterium UBA8960]|jgi:Xaa-Pro aminopeptidase|nr:peptidase M24 [Clostridiales bacterium UBA8960]